MRELHLFAGIGGGILAGELLGHRCVGAVELDPYCRRVLEARQADGSLPPFPIHDDVRTFDGTAWRGKVDIVCGGFPCQPWSAAGKRLGAADERHLWPAMARVIAEVRPALVFAENVSLAAFAEPWRDLRGLGYRVPPALCLAAADVGACHLRKRWWLLAADADRRRLAQQPQRDGEPERGEHGALGNDSERRGEVAADANGETRRRAARDAVARDGDEAVRAGTQESGRRGDASNADRERRGRRSAGELADGREARSPVEGHAGADTDAAAHTGRARLEEWKRLQGERGRAIALGDRWWPTVPALCGADARLPRRVDRLRALGNAQVPLCAATAFRELWRRLSA